MFPKGIVASIQPSWNHGISQSEIICAIARECSRYAVALRIEGTYNVRMVAKAIRGIYNIPIIGIVKSKQNALNTFITRSKEEVYALIDSGASYVAMELTDRLPTDRIQECVSDKIPVIADIADLKHAMAAQEIGVQAITTALSGYVDKVTHPFVAPDIKLVHQCVQNLDIPVIAEGRYNTQLDFIKAKEAGAYAVCIGTLIHEPKNTVNRSRLIFEGTWEENSKNDFINLV